VNQKALMFDHVPSVGPGPFAPERSRRVTYQDTVTTNIEKEEFPAQPAPAIAVAHEDSPGKVADAGVDQTTTAARQAEDHSDVVWPSLRPMANDLMVALRDQYDNEVMFYAKELKAARALLSAIMGIYPSLGKYFTQDGSVITLNVKVILDQLRTLRATILPGKGLLPPSKFIVESFKGADALFQAQDWVRAHRRVEPDPSYHLADNGVDQGPVTEAAVTPDLTVLDQIIALFEGLGTPDAEGKIALAIAQFSILKTAVDAKIALLEDAVRTLAQKYANAYSKNENFYKVICSVIETLCHSLRGYMQY